MFVLSSLEDNVPVAPRDLARPLLESVADALRARYLDRVVPGLGLAVALYALDAVVGGGGRLYPATGTAGGGAGGGGGGGGGGGPSGGAAAAAASSGAPPGAAYYRARFRLAFFRPFAGEVLVGTLVEATRWGGLRVAIGGAASGAGAGAPAAAAIAPPPLPSSSSAAAAAAAAAATAAAQQRLADAVFRDVIVRPTDMPPKSSWDAKERTWVWSYEDGTPFLMDIGGQIRVRVTGVRYPTPPTPAERRAAQQAAAMAAAQQQQAQQQQNGDVSAGVAASWVDAEVPPPVGSAANPFAPMEVLASANGDGLGMVEWWTPEEEEEGGEGVEGAEGDEGGGAGGGGDDATAAPMET